MTEREEPPVGALGEEAARLLQALQEWSRVGSQDGGGNAAHGVLRDLNEHIATGGVDCRYCPVCQLIAAVRATSPEVKNHLVVAATSLLQAAAGLMATQTEGSRSASGPVEHIDLDDDDWEDDD